MTNKECVNRWAEYIIPAVFKAENALLKEKPEWKKMLENIPADNASEIAAMYCREIAEIIVKASEDDEEKETREKI